jgi:DNA-binding FadR family transcriptional regulator
MDTTRKPFAAARGSATITRELRKAILDGEYNYGDRLPAERQLAEHFQTSRSTVREALRQLEELKMVERRLGSGTFITCTQRMEDSRIAEVTSPIQLVEVRLGFEPQMVRLAVLYATARDLERLKAALRRVEAETTDQDAFSRADEQFHLSLAECSGNPLIIWFYQQLNTVRGHAQWDAMKTKILTPERIAEYNREHRTLFDAVESRDKTAAEKVILEHLARARRDLLGADAH